MQMGDCRNIAEYAVARMQSARQEILDLLNDPSGVGKPVDDFDAYQLRVALEHITDGLLMDSLQCQSSLNELDRQKWKDDEPPSDVTIPSPTVAQDEDVDKLLHCDESIGDPYSFDSSNDSCGGGRKWMNTIFARSSSPGVYYHPEDESEDDD